MTSTARGATALAVAALVVGACTAGTAGKAESGDPGAPMEITWLAAGGQALHDELARLDHTVADLVAGKVQR